MSGTKHAEPALSTPRRDPRRKHRRRPALYGADGGVATPSLHRSSAPTASRPLAHTPRSRTRPALLGGGTTATRRRARPFNAPPRGGPVTSRSATAPERAAGAKGGGRADAPRPRPRISRLRGGAGRALSALRAGAVHALAVVGGERSVGARGGRAGSRGARPREERGSPVWPSVSSVAS